MTDACPLYELDRLTKAYQGPGETVEVLKELSFTVRAGESIAILGASGSGKTTLLHVMGGLDTATSGQVRFQGEDLSEMNEAQRDRLRNQGIGFVFQFHHLLSEFTARENVAMPARIKGMAKKEALEMADQALESVGLSHRAAFRVTMLSGGERQRAAIARAIVLKPRILLADEPTGNLDEGTGARIGELLVRLNSEAGVTLVVVTHNRDLANRMQRRMELHGGDLADVA